MPSKIEWCDETLNPQGWGCWGPGGTPEQPQRCWYCYVERQANGPYVPDCELCRKLIPHWHPERLELPYRWKRPRRIFWQSMGDLFHPCTPREQIAQIQTLALATPQQTHIFCTKNPARYAEFNPWPANCILLTTVTGLGKREEGRIDDLLLADCRVRGVSLEPLLGSVDLRPYLPISNLSLEEKKTWWQCICGATAMPLTDDTECNCQDYYDQEWKHHALGWLIIGAYTGKGASRFTPAAAWVQSLIDQGRAANVPVFLKNNLRWPEKIQEFPDAH